MLTKFGLSEAMSHVRCLFYERRRLVEAPVEVEANHQRIEPGDIGAVEG